MGTHEPPDIHVGILGLETTGLADRNIAVDILHALTIEAGLTVAFHMDCAFDSTDLVWDTVENTTPLHILMISLRPTSGVLLPRLQRALDTRLSNGLTLPLVVLGGQTALAAPDIIKDTLPNSLVLTSDAELAFPKILSTISRPDNTLGKDSVQSEPASNLPARRFITPAQFSTARAAQAGGTIWIEASRGCHLNCSFCVLSSDAGLSAWCPRDIEELFEEIQYISHHFGICDFSFSDFSAFESEDFVDAFVSEAKRRSVEFSFRCDLRLGTARRIHDKLVDLRRAGLRQVYVGVESLIPEQQRIYGKGYPGKSIIDHILALDIGVVVGFIMLDPLASRGDFRHQVIGIREKGLLDLVATPLKTMRIQLGTKYEKLAIERGIVDKLNTDLYSYSYHCADPALEVVRQVVDFFHQTTKVVYYNPYIDNMLRYRGGDINEKHIQVLHNITGRYKNAEYRLLDEISKAIVESDEVSGVVPVVMETARWFSLQRKFLFEQTARDYENLLKSGMRHYRADLERFLNMYTSIPIFDDSCVEI